MIIRHCDICLRPVDDEEPAQDILINPSNNTDNKNKIARHGIPIVLRIKNFEKKRPHICETCLKVIQKAVTSIPDVVSFDLLSKGAIKDNITDQPVSRQISAEDIDFLE